MAFKTTDSQAWKPEIDNIIDDELALLGDAGLDKLFTVKGTDRLQINEVGISGYQPMQMVGELDDAPEDQPIETYGFSYQRQTYRKMTVFSSDILQTDQIGIVEQKAKQIARTAKYTRGLNAYGVFRKAFNASVVYGDTKPYISTLHPRKDGAGTQTNTFADGVQRELGYDNVKLLEDQLYAQVSNVGNILQIGNATRNKLLVVPYALREKAFQIAGIEGPDEKPGTADNDKNYFRKGARFDVYIPQFLGFESAKQAGEIGTATKTANNYWDTMWFIMDSDAVKMYLKFFYANGYEKYYDKVREENEAFIKIVHDKYAYGLSGWFGAVGSKGDNSTYSS